MTAIQLNFSLRTNPKCRSVQLVGSWDGYGSTLPLSRDGSRDGGWKGTFRFSAPTMTPGARYWYYYIIDGTHVSHDPARDATVEPTTGRKLNILDIPRPKGSSGSSSSKRSSHHGSSSSSRGSHGGAKGRSLSPSQISHPLPSRPYETQLFRTEKFSGREMEALSRRYAAQRLSSPDSLSSSSDSDGAGRYYSDVPSFSSRSSHNSSPSSVSSVGSPVTPGDYSPVLPRYGSYAYSTGKAVGLGLSGMGCTCERYAVMRDGRKVRVDCGGKVCGGSGSECSDSSVEEESSEDERRRHRHHHRSSRPKKSGGKSHRSSHGVKGLLFGKR